MTYSPRNKTIRAAACEKKYTTGICSDFSCIEKNCNTIIHADAITCLKKIPDHCIDLIVADPPYNLTKVYAGKTFRATDALTYETWLTSWVGECKRVLKKTGTIYICADWQSGIQVYNVLQKYFHILTRITREREKGRGAQKNRKNAIEDIYVGVCDQKNYTFNTNAVKIKKNVVAPYVDATTRQAKDWVTEGNKKYRLTHPSNVWTDLTIPFWSMAENTEHPTQKPEKLLAKILLASSNPGDLVLDPFLGSGTTAVVAKKLERKFIGIEAQHDYCVIAQKRLVLATKDNTIQGYENGVFLGRNEK